MPLSLGSGLRVVPLLTYHVWGSSSPACAQTLAPVTVCALGKMPSLVDPLHFCLIGFTPHKQWFVFVFQRKPILSWD